MKEKLTKKENFTEEHNKKILLDLIKNNPVKMDILRAVRDLNLPDWCIGAGFVRNPVLDYLHGYKKETPPGDTDVAYFDASNLDEEVEKKYEDQLRKIIDNVEWSVTNQARMGKINNQNKDYVSTEDALGHWPETATSIGIRLNNNDQLELVAPHGIDDLFNLRLVMTPEFGDGQEAFLNRIEKKEWLTRWPKLKITK